MLNKTIDWVKSTEKAACRFYEKAQEQFGYDRELEALLGELAGDERKHYEMVSVACALSGGMPDLPPGISVDTAAMREIGSRLRQCEKRLEAGELKKDDLVDAIVTIEFSECNEIFLYAITVMKAFPGEFRKAANEIKKHKVRIETFLKGRPEYSAHLDTIRKLPEPGDERILVVDDEAAMIDLYEVFLSQIGTVETAVNGVEALAKMEGKPFSAVVTDIDMPVMNGLELYSTVTRRHPALKDRFIFVTGSFDDSRTRFFKDNKLKYLMKPVSIKDIKKAVLDIIER